MEKVVDTYFHYNRVGIILFYNVYALFFLASTTSWNWCRYNALTDFTTNA